MLTLFSLRKIQFGVLLILSLIFFQQTAFSQPLLLDPVTHPKFDNDLPVIKELGLRVDLTSSKNLNVQMIETRQDLGLTTPGGYTDTKVWAYQFPNLPPTYPGATIVAKRDKKVKVKWENYLPGHFLPVDATLHMAHPSYLHSSQEVKAWYDAGNVPVVTHLHGGHTESASDGLPEAWFTQGFSEMGKYFEKKRYVYDNDQEAATLWYHDHALGITRLNVYAGLAGFYLLRDDNELAMIDNGTLPGGDYEIEIVVQDRMFYDNGELFLPSSGGDPFFDGIIPPGGFGGVEPSVVAEFFGDFILVNGKAWPKLDVEQTKYRFRMLNGSDSRFYNFKIQDGSGSTISFYQIGTDNGFLENPVTLSELLLAPGERADLIVDFTGLTGQFTVVNTGPDEPFKGGNFNPDVTRPTGQIMRFDVVAGGTPPTFYVSGSTPLRETIDPLTPTGATRKLALFEGEDADGRLQPLLGVINGDNEKVAGGTLNGSLAWFEDITENPNLNDVEVWEVYNATEDAHPIHLHLVSFQILERRPFEAVVISQSQIQHDSRSGIGGYMVESSITFTGPSESPAANEDGWKDTFIIPPGYMGKVIAKFDREGRYVWHCHILSHEDHEMMRPYHVGPLPLEKQSGDVLASVTDYNLEQNYPNPFNPSTVINFSVPEENTLVSLKIYSSLGEEVGTLINQIVPAGNHEVQFNATSLPSGVYFYTLTAGNFVETKKMMLMK